MKNISIASFSFHGLESSGNMDVFTYLESVKYRYRLHTADLGISNTGHRLLKSTEPDYLQKVKDAMDERELELVNLCVDGANIYDPDPEVREQNYKYGLECMKAAEFLGAKTIRMDIGENKSKDAKVLDDEQFELVVNRYREYAQIAYDSGFLVGPENHFGVSLIPGNIKKISEAVDHPGYGVLLHLERWEEDKDIGDEMVGKWAMHTHFDSHISKKDLTVPIQKMLKLGYKGCWGIEFGPDMNEYSEVEWVVSTIERDLARI